MNYRNIALLLWTMSVTSVFAQEKQDNKLSPAIQWFEKEIRPVLVSQCYRCHSQDAGKSKGGLRVDTREALLRGGESGPAIVPRSPEKSLLYQAITYRHEKMQMPPKGKLPEKVILNFRKWIVAGAPDPRVSQGGLVVQSKIDIEAGRNYWAYQAPSQPTLPNGKNKDWARTDIDRFILATLESKKLTPAKDATIPVLIRRLYFVLTGLPPTPQAVEKWTTRIRADRNEYRKLVDELLDSPQYGERWGRHWMDVVRFAESTGGDSNNIYPHAWRYRDYIIDAFNEDKPFNRFIQEQIAGDLLPIKNDKDWATNLIATGFLSVGVKLVGEEDQPKFYADLVDEQIDATTRAFLATTVACARCHDHKFDPIPQVDYYALAGIFRSTAPHYGLIRAQARQSTTLLDVTGMGLVSARKKLTADELAALIKNRDETRAEVENMMAKIRGGTNVFRGALRRGRSRRDEAEAALQSYDDKGNPRIFVMGTQDRDYPLKTRLLIRGELDKPGQLVPRGVIQVIAGPNKHQLSKSVKGSGRLQLANWLASSDNPLTARVIANRVWHWLFGRGIVRTVDDFGKTGDRPTHPELLDYLALRLIKHNWSIKALIRDIVHSRTWQLSSDFDEKNYAIDPDNQFLWRANKRRLEAEAIRDAMLTVSGNLDLNRPLGTLLSSVGEGSVGLGVFEPEIRKLDSNRRSVYLPRVRNVLPEPLELFDAPDASLVLGARETTGSPLQSLYLLNNAFVQTQAEAFAQRLAKVKGSERFVMAHQLALGRKPTDEELNIADSFATSFQLLTGDSERQWLTAYCQALLCTNEFRTID